MPRQPQPAPFDGALVIHKPRGKTSHDVVDAVRHLAGFRQIGHLGTLDPLATGVLVLLLGRVAAERVGRFQQVPPAFSAEKIQCRAAYELARKKEVVELKPVDVELFEYRLADLEGTLARFVIECSSGTYIRSLAHEMGEKLGCGAHLAEIERTAVGEFSIEQAIPLEELASAARAGKLPERVIPLEHLLPHLPRVNVLPMIEKRVRHGSKFNVSLGQISMGRSEAIPGAVAELDSGPPQAPRLRVFSQQNKLIAIAEALVPRTYRPIVVFEPLP